MRKIGLIFSLLILFPVRGYAVLGEAADTSIHPLTRTVTKRSNLSIQYLEHSESNVTVREYAGDDGKIFAVKWHGQGRPNLPVLLGKYHPEFSVAASSPNVRIPRRGLAATSNNLEIVSYGTMSNLHGLVILKNNVPANLKANDLP